MPYRDEDYGSADAEYDGFGDKFKDVCVACSIDHHRHCGMQTWCACEDPEDGEASREEVEACKECEEAQLR